MAFRFPFSNLHELGLDWILEQVKTFSELIPEMETSAEDIQHAQETADNANQAAAAAQETADEAIELIAQIPGSTPSDELPVIDGTPSPGTSLKFSRGDHKHPTDTSRASQSDLDTLQNQVNGLVIPVPSSDTPNMDGTASAGSSANYSRKDHVHPTDTSRASATDLAALSARVDNISGGATPSTADPMMDGTASAGISANYSRGDHVHPTDTSRASATDLAALSARVDNISGGATPSSADPMMDGTASAGISANYSRGDHVHPTDTSRASASDLTTLQNQVNGIVVPTASSANPAMDGTAAPGSASTFSRSDHVHPSDTNRACIKSVAYSAIDTLTETGFYTTTGTVAVLYFIRWDGNYGLQVGNFFGETDLKYRIKTGGNWSAWAVLGGSTGTVMQNITITLPASWTSAGTNIYTQTLSGLTNVTANTKIDLNPGASAILQMVSDGTYAIYVENNNGTFTVYAVGTAPTAPLTISGVRYETV